MIIISGGSKGGGPGNPPTGQNFLNFMQLFGNFGKIVCWRPPLEGWRPSYENPGSAPSHVLLDKNILANGEDLYI